RFRRDLRRGHFHRNDQRDDERDKARAKPKIHAENSASNTDTTGSLSLNEVPESCRAEPSSRSQLSPSNVSPDQGRSERMRSLLDELGRNQQSDVRVTGSTRSEPENLCTLVRRQRVLYTRFTRMARGSAGQDNSVIPTGPGPS